MEYEIEIFNDTKANYSTKYMLIEKLHISNNKIQDIYSVTKYPHRLFNLSFEKKFKKHKYMTKGYQIREDGDKFYDIYYKTYLEESLDSQLEARNDFDSYLNELFPNHEQHLELMVRILYLLSSSIKIMENFVKAKPEGTEDRNKSTILLKKLEFSIQVIMMACVLRIEEKLSNAAEKNLSSILEDFRFNEKIYEHLEVILNKKMISNDTYYREIGIIKLFRIVYRLKIDEDKIKKIFESAVDGIKLVEQSLQKEPPGLNTINHCRFVYEMINIFISVTWFQNNEENFIRSFDRKVFDIATNMHKKVAKIPCSGSDLIDKFSFRELMCKYMNEKNTWGNHWQVWLQNKRLDILELILEVLDMDESYPFRDRFIRYYDLRILCRDIMNVPRDRQERLISIHMRQIINKYFNVLNKRIPSAFVNTIKFLELLFTILKKRISETPELLNYKESRFIVKIILDFFISFIKYSKNPCTLLLYTIELYSECNSFLFEDFNKLLSEYIPVHFTANKISSLIKGTLK